MLHGWGGPGVFLDVESPRAPLSGEEGQGGDMKQVKPTSGRVRADSSWGERGICAEGSVSAGADWPESRADPCL